MPALEECKDFTVKAIYSRSKESADKLSAGKYDVYYDKNAPKDKNLTALLARSDIDAVVVVLPILVQPDIIKQAIQAGKHVLSEKPVAKDVATANELIQWYQAHKGKTLWGVAEQMRYDPKYVKASELVAKGEIGDVKFVSYRSQGNVKAGDKYFETPWRKHPDYQGGFILDGGVHSIAAIRLTINQEIKRVSGYTRLNYDYLPPKDTVHASLQLTNGATGTLALSFASGEFNKNEFYVVGTKGYLSVGSDITLTVGGDTKKIEPGKIPVSRGVSQSFQAQINGFAKSINQGHLLPASAPEEALRDLAVIEGLLTSGEHDGNSVVVS